MHTRQQQVCTGALGVGFYGLVLGTFFFTLGQIGEGKVISTQARDLTNSFVLPAATTGAAYDSVRDELQTLAAMELPHPKKPKLSKSAKGIMGKAFGFFVGLAALGTIICFTVHRLDKSVDFPLWHCVLEAALVLLSVFVTQSAFTFLFLRRYSNASVPLVLSYVIQGLVKSRETHDEDDEGETE